MNGKFIHWPQTLLILPQGKNATLVKHHVKTLEMWDKQNDFFSTKSLEESITDSGNSKVIAQEANYFFLEDNVKITSILKH